MGRAIQVNARAIRYLGVNRSPVRCEIFAIDRRCCIKPGMDEALLNKYELQKYRDAIQAVEAKCLVGEKTKNVTGSYCGGFPKVDAGFVWPTKDGYPLDFIAQLRCKELGLLIPDSGWLLFFYDNRHWGGSPKDLGFAVVLHQRGDRALTTGDLPSCEMKRLFGLVTSHIQPKVFQQVGIRFRPGCSFPSLERELIKFDDEGWEDAYGNFAYESSHQIQSGGFPNPIQEDFMEYKCIKAFSSGTRNDWQLLLQLFEVGDMEWGDAGALYWFILKEDLAKGRFDRVWMVTQCG